MATVDESANRRRGLRELQPRRGLKGRMLRSLRIAAAAAVFLLLHVSLFVSAPWAERLVRQLARLQFLPASIGVLTGALAWTVLGFLPVLLLTLVAGRIYCSVLCPLGVLQDILICLKGKVRRARCRALPPRRTLHMAAAGLSLVLFAGGVPLLVNLFEPYAFWGRGARDLVLPLVSGGSVLVSEAAKNLDIFFAPLSFFGHIPVVAVTGLLFALLLVLTIVRGRRFCNTLCPTGALLRLPGLVPHLPLFEVRVNPEACTLCGLCEKICRTGSIMVREGGAFPDGETCVVCFECIARCPYDAMSFASRAGSAGVAARAGSALPGSERAASCEKAASESRRGFLRRLRRSFGGAVTGVPAVGFLFGGGIGRLFDGTYGKIFRLRAAAPDGGENRPAVPPGAKSTARFSEKCISCHSCVSVCPTHVLQPSLFEYGLQGFMQPVMDYGTGYCEFDCISCLKVCPVGAILPLSLKEKQKTQIGRVQFIKDRCVIFSEGTACGACAEVCPTGAVWMVPYLPEITQPETDNEICVGCGNCEYACPVAGGKAIYVKGNDVHVERVVKKNEEKEATVAEPEEFPF